ncbi:MAG: DEAD/DEAH box helicase [Treponema sp.]|jgi:ATP-dependent RNA helicase RhlB|nr:DEAD/DEAH box helicase [Treponema sp.]
MDFSEFNLHSELQRGIADAGYVTCMPVQEQVLVNAFGGRDLYVQSQTGTGKTAAFLIVIFQRLLAEPLLGGKKALIMVPTRELAVQVEEEAKVLGKYLPFKTGSFYGGVGYAQQQRLLKDNVQILVGTPGRVLDLNKSGLMNLMDIAFLVLDEADRMFDMGFYPDLRKLIRVVPPVDRRQTMLFSATLNTWVKNLAWEYTKEPFEIDIEPETVTVDEVEQALYHVPSGNKMKLLLGILEREQPESAIIFCNTKRYAEIVAKRLRINGYNCEFIIGDLPQVKRLKIIDDIKAGSIRFLAATDVAARGLDIEDLALVVNYDLPVEPENYVHRIGRTARAGKTGKAVTLVSEQDVYELPDIEKYIGKKIPSQIAGEELYTGDKSEGVRIRTDFYDDRGWTRGEPTSGPPGRSGHRDQRRGPPSEGRSGRGPTASQAGRSRDRRTGGGDGRSGRSGPGDPAQTGSRRTDSRETPDLAQLPLEKRMAYYREKYNSPQSGKTAESRGPSGRDKKRARSGESGGAGRTGRGERTGDSGPRTGGGRSGSSEQRAGGGHGRRGGASAGAGPQDPGRQRRNKPRTAARETAADTSPEVSAGTEKKRGIIGKLLGIFGKKE